MKVGGRRGRDRQVGFTGGTHRLVPPEETLRRIRPHLERCGISREADITGLDSLGVPVFCIIRPTGSVLQASQGKGARVVDARVSGLMEAIEIYYAENPIVDFRFASYNELRSAAANPVAPRRLPGFDEETYYDDDYRLHWCEADDLLGGGKAYVPASFGYFLQPSLYTWNTNGLASGNSVMEATLHAMYELYERDALSELVDGEDVDLSRCEVIDLDSIDHPIPAVTLQRLADAGVGIRLLRIPVIGAIHTFIAVLLDPKPFANASSVNLGYGAHLCPAVAASRALTEAAQSRLTYIHGAREDLELAAYSETHEALYEYMESMQADTSWRGLDDRASGCLERDYALALAQFREEGCAGLWRTVMTERALDFAVVKVHMPGARSDFPVF